MRRLLDKRHLLDDCKVERGAAWTKNEVGVPGDAAAITGGCKSPAHVNYVSDDV
jgi:hypothetical protein